jgi:hypothetical protein
VRDAGQGAGAARRAAALFVERPLVLLLLRHARLACCCCAPRSTALAARRSVQALRAPVRASLLFPRGACAVGRERGAAAAGEACTMCRRPACRTWGAVPLAACPSKWSGAEPRRLSLLLHRATRVCSSQSQSAAKRPR